MPGPTSVEQVINQALVRIGYKGRIGSVYDGTPAAKAALEVYGQTRDDVLRDNTYGFSERQVDLTLLKQAPAGGYIPPTVWNNTYPPLPWFYEYAYPADCLKVRAVKPQPLFIPPFRPQPQNFSIYNDTGYFPAQKTIVCNTAGAICVYTGQIIDMTTWEPLFVEDLVAALASRLAPTLATLDQMKLRDAEAEAKDEAQATNAATMERG